MEALFLLAGVVANKVSADEVDSLSVFVIYVDSKLSEVPSPPREAKLHLASI